MPDSATATTSAVDRKETWKRYLTVRRFSETLCEPLCAEDMVLQSMPDASPTRWHLAHTTWAFETFVLSQADSEYSFYCDAYRELFNSYYNTVGEQFPRHHRGLLSRPTVAEVLEYRRAIDEQIADLIERIDEQTLLILSDAIEITLHHEQQHQELMLTDIKHAFSCNPLYPAFRHCPDSAAPNKQDSPPNGWRAFREGLYHVGHDGDGFAYDNESPRHRTFLKSFALTSRPVTNGEYLEFILDEAYRRPELWLAEGWQAVQDHRWQAPQYWVKQHGAWQQFTLHGLQPLDMQEPVCHVSYFEADAFARWRGERLPTEFEWEVASNGTSREGNFVESDRLHPRPALQNDGQPIQQLFGDVWEWTASPYMGYPGYEAYDGALAEYNGKFMCNQLVLRGGSCVTSQSHIRSTYRNFFPPSARWQFSGFRTAR